MAKRLPNTQQPVGIHSKNSPNKLLLLGVPFVGVGCWIGLIGLRLIEVEPDSVKAPYPVLGLIGMIFGIAGLMIWTMAFRHLWILRRIFKQKKGHPNNPAMADYPWNPQGYSPPKWKPTFNAWVGSLLFSLFGSVLFWLAFGKGSAPLFLEGMSFVMGFILVWVYAYAIKVTWHTLKYGTSTLVFNEFPMSSESSINVEIKLPMSLHRAKSATLTLRHIEEFYEASGSGKNRRSTLVQEVHSETIQELTPADLAMWSRAIKSEFQLPENAPTTKLHAEHPRYWHLELTLDAPGLDFKAEYLLPIY